MGAMAQQHKLEGMGKLWKRPRQGEQGVSEEQYEEWRGRLRKLFKPVRTGSKCKRKVEGKGRGEVRHG